MTDFLLIAVIVLLIANLILSWWTQRRRSALDPAPLLQGFERIERVVREEITRDRQESAEAARHLRGELAAALKGVGDTLNKQLVGVAQVTDQKLDRMRDTVEQRLQTIQAESAAKLGQMREEAATAASKARDEVNRSLAAFNESLTRTLSDMGGNQRLQLANVVEQIRILTETTYGRLEAQRLSIDERLREIQAEGTSNAKSMREEVAQSVKGLNDAVLQGMTAMAAAQHGQMEAFSGHLTKLIESNEAKFEGVKTAVEQKLTAIQTDNAKQLEQMRTTVDEKLQSTLEKRLGESFKLVSDRLEQVHKGLGEMQSLASGVGDLKKVLTNVKSRGTWGEVQLGAMLEQVLTPEQYDKNVATKAGGERVEFAIKFLGHGEDKSEVMWLPIDAKFPTEDYQRLVEAQEKGDGDAAEVCAKDLERRIKGCALDICSKYINAPKTTDFAILFLPTEGLFAEVVRRIGLAETIQRECKVMIAGPTTLWSILNSLQMGFRTLAIQQRSSEVWNLLAAVKTEFGKYGQVLGKVQKKLQEASNTIDTASVRTRAIERQLRNVQTLSSAESSAVLLLGEIEKQESDLEFDDDSMIAAVNESADVVPVRGN